MRGGGTNGSIKKMQWPSPPLRGGPRNLLVFEAFSDPDPMPMFLPRGSVSGQDNGCGAMVGIERIDWCMTMHQTPLRKVAGRKW